jgi:hypothetical protein
MLIYFLRTVGFIFVIEFVEKPFCFFLCVFSITRRSATFVPQIICATNHCAGIQRGNYTSELSVSCKFVLPADWIFIHSVGFISFLDGLPVGVCWCVLVCVLCWYVLVCVGVCLYVLCVVMVCAGVCWCLLVCVGVCWYVLCAGVCSVLCVVICWCVSVFAGVCWNVLVCICTYLTCRLWIALEQIAAWGASFNEVDSHTHTHCEGHLTSLQFQSQIGCVARHLVILISILLWYCLKALSVFFPHVLPWNGSETKWPAFFMSK